MLTFTKIMLQYNSNNNVWKNNSMRTEEKMFCTKCGAQVSDDSVFCHQCGSAISAAAKDQINNPEQVATTVNTQNTVHQPQQQPTQQTPHQQASGGRDDGIYGLLGFILSFFVAIAGLILSIIGLSKTKNRGFAVAGLVISIVSMVIYVIVIIVAIATVSSVASNPNYWYYYNYLVCLA